MSSGGFYNGGDAGFSSISMSARVEKKFLGSFASRNMAKHFITPTAGSVLDNIYKILKEFYSKKEAEKVVKNVIKIIIKLSVLNRNGQFSAEEMAEGEKFNRKFSTLVKTFVSFKVQFSYDRTYLSGLMAECQAILTALIKRHLSDKSVQRATMVFGYFMDGSFLDVLFRSPSPYEETLQLICAGVNKMTEEGEI